MERKWRNIRLKDVQDAMTRGEWTADDERRWKEEKPFACKCGERFSARFASETRHKCRYTTARPKIKCPAGCKAMFAHDRADNVKKHLRKFHPQFSTGKSTPRKSKAGAKKDEEAEGQDPIEALTAQFKKFPNSEDLPGPVHGFKLFYTRGRLPFLPPEFLSHYAEYYFSTKNFHSYLPILHQPTFRPVSSLASFLRSVCAIGGLYDPTNSTLSGQLWESGWRVLERWIETGPEGEDEERQAVAHGNASYRLEGREGRLEVLQGLLLFSIYGITAADKDKLIKGRRLLQRSVEVARIHGHFRPTPIDEEEATTTAAVSLETQWANSIVAESRKRTAFALYLVDFHISLLFNTPQMVRLAELKSLALPCAESLFSAESPAEWNHRRVSGHSLSLCEKYRGMFNGTLGTVDPPEASFESVILLTALQTEILATTRRICEYADLNLETTTTHTSQKLKCFPPSSSSSSRNAEIVTLRNCVNTLGRAYGGGQLYAPATMGGAIENFIEFFDDTTTNTTAPTAPAFRRLAGLERMFYIGYHFAHILLYIPDRSIVHDDGAVATDLNSAFRGMAERCYRSTSIQDSRFTEMMTAEQEKEQEKEKEKEKEEKTLLSHVSEILKYLDSSYDEDDRATEFPAVAVMIFKIVLVAWEILVTIHSSSDSVQSYIAQKHAESLTWNNFGEPSVVSAEDDYSWIMGGNDIAVDMFNDLGDTEFTLGHDPVVLSFWKKTDAIVGSWESSMGEASIPENLPVRFVRWMQMIMVEMECWDVGKAACDALDVLSSGI